MRHYCRSMYWRPAYAHGRSTSSNTKNNCYETRGHRGAHFGVRRPLRYLSYQLDLSENQMRRNASPQPQCPGAVAEGRREAPPGPRY